MILQVILWWLSFQKWCTMFYDSRCLNATYQWLREERISGQVCQFSDMKQFVCHQVAFMEKFCGRIGQVIVIYHPILCYSPMLQPHQLTLQNGFTQQRICFWIWICFRVSHMVRIFDEFVYFAILLKRCYVSECFKIM